VSKTRLNKIKKIAGVVIGAFALEHSRENGHER